MTVTLMLPISSVIHQVGQFLSIQVVFSRHISSEFFFFSKTNVSAGLLASKIRSKFLTG